MLNAGKDEAAVLQALEVSQSMYELWRRQYGGMKAEEAKRLKEIVADLTLENKMLKHLMEGNCRASLARAWTRALPESGPL